ncbi:M48 family metalloprotease [Neptuniibacter sp. SY11_33]|uniref:M48 family metalloprotease n=1 Tax=Neptuniibacter sp. SY11_33 TaxID=3398215 RepID=UPI0039F483C7
MFTLKKNAIKGVITSFLLMGLSGCQVNNINLTPLMEAGKKSTDLFEKSLAEEVEIGEEVSTVLLQKASIYNVRDVQSYVNSVGMWLAQQTERTDIPWTFSVIRDDSFNAFATPGGFIYITTGTLEQLQSEAELAGVLAHEIAHVVQKHHLRAIQKEAKIGIAADIARFLRDSQSDSSDSSGATVFGDHSVENKLLNTIQDVYSDGLARSDELEADKMGMVIAARAGYDPMAYIAVLQKIDAQQDDSAFWQAFSKRHPSAEDRLAELYKLADQMSYIEGKELNNRYSKMIK